MTGMTEYSLIIVLLLFMAATAVALTYLRNLFSVVMLSGVFSFLGAVIYVFLDAVDVAFTEAAVGPGISTVLMLAILTFTKREEKESGHKISFPALILVTMTGAALVYGTLDMPPFADAFAPANVHIANYYLENAPIETGIPNVVTSILASYRSYDTLGETFVIFTAAIGVLTIIGRIPGGKKIKMAKKLDDNERHSSDQINKSPEIKKESV